MADLPKKLIDKRSRFSKFVLSVIKCDIVPKNTKNMKNR
jgi:hypothetical protein